MSVRLATLTNVWFIMISGSGFVLCYAVLLEYVLFIAATCGVQLLGR